MGLKINGSTSGSIEIDVPAVAGTNTAITIPATNGGEFIVSDSSGNIDLGALDISGSASADSVNIDASGRLLVGTSSGANSYDGIDPQFQLEGMSIQTSSASLFCNSNDANGPFFLLGSSRGTSDGSATIVQSGDTLGAIEFVGADGTDRNTPGALIKCEVDAVPGANSMAGRLVFSTNTGADGAAPTERMRILNSGRINTYSEAEGLSISVAGTSNLIFIGKNNSGSIGSGTNQIFIYNNGNIENTNNSYGGISDIKLKENIVDASSQWDDIKALRPVNYNFKPETGYETFTQLGLIAQEVELVSPGLVNESPDRDEDGNDLGTVTKSVNYSVLYMKAIKALQEAMERIETLETANASFEARLTALEGGAA